MKTNDENTSLLSITVGQRKKVGLLAVRPAKFIGLILMILAGLCPKLVLATGITWPTGQLLPVFSTPVAVLDCVDMSSASGAEIDLIASLQGIVNRTQPQIITVTSGDGEGTYTWVTAHNLQYTLVADKYSLITKYRSYVTGLVVTDPAQMHTLNLATTIAGVKNVLICDPSLLTKLTSAPYSLPIVDDLRGKFADKYAVYNYLYTTYWSQCTHRMFAGMYTNINGCLRDYLVANKVATVWLNPSTAQDKTCLNQFGSGMTALNSVFVGWWPDEGSGLGWLAGYGIPALASDFYRNGSVYSGVRTGISIPAAPTPPPLRNKIYVAMILSDGDNAQYVQHVMKMDWDGPVRGSIPITWTITALLADIDPGMLNYYWNSASANDCLISGPSGAGYIHVENWSSANLTSFTKLTESYLQRSGLRYITVWDSVNSTIANNYAANCPSLLGLTDQAGSYSGVDSGLRTIKENPTYPSLVSQLTNALNSAAAGWNGTSPMFIAAQADVWGIPPRGLKDAMTALGTNGNFVFVRLDHLFTLANQAANGTTTSYFMIVNKNSGKCLDLISGNTANGAVINQWTYDYNGNNQRWSILPTENANHFKLISRVTGKCACMAQDSTATGAQLYDWTYTGNNTAQQFDFVDAGNGWFKIKNVKSGLILEVAGSSTADNAKVQQNTDTSAANQLWRLQPWGDYFIKANSGRYVCIQSAGSANGSRIIQYDWENNPWFKWRFTSEGDGWYGLFSLNALTRVLCVEGGSTVAGHWCHLWDYNTSNVGDQKIRILPQPNGTFKFFFAHDGMSWDIPGNQTGNNIELDQYTPNSNAQQNFKMVSVP